MATDKTDYNLKVVEQHLAECDTCTHELSRSTTTKERIDARCREDEPLTADEVHRIVSQGKETTQ